MTPSRPISIAVAPNGGRKTQADHPALPMTAAELARVGSLCLEAGASMIHVHVRDREGRHLLDAEAYRDALASIRRSVGERLVVQITSESLGIYSPAEQMQVIRQVRPESVSLALRELLPDAHGETGLSAFLQWLRKENVAPQFILYSPEEAIHLAALKARGVIPFEQLSVLYVLGRYTVGQASDPMDLLPFLDDAVPRFSYWTTCAFGPKEAACVLAGALLGGNIRVGFENNLLLPDGRVARGNEELVGVAKDCIVRLGYRPATADELRANWRLG
ncbi:3-keto-5-aminohexanoate cleavage protein [Mesorhizobium shangrilense]|uniref:3-keto-5-aminohexanoate cleavage protein n=1 Tax=Mesorhizobium shangrilense TaxID=460060 RepID=A0ABV2DEH6_9HYPH